MGYIISLCNVELKGEFSGVQIWSVAAAWLRRDAESYSLARTNGNIHPSIWFGGSGGKIK